MDFKHLRGADSCVIFGWIDGLFFFSLLVFFFIYILYFCLPDVIAACTKCAGFSDCYGDKWTEILYIHVQYGIYIVVFINMQCNIRRLIVPTNANCNGYQRCLVTRSATAFTLGPVRKFFLFFYYRITSGKNASSSTWPSWPTSRSREQVTNLTMILSLCRTLTALLVSLTHARWLLYLHVMCNSL